MNERGKEEADDLRFTSACDHADNARPVCGTQLDPAWGELMAYLTVLTVPVLILFLALQRTFVESIALEQVGGEWLIAEEPWPIYCGEG